MEIVIIGCGAAGGTAAQFARKNNRTAEITIIEKGPYPQYSRCGLPYILSGKVEHDKLIEFSQEWFQKSRINLLLNTPVEHIDFNKHNVHTATGEKKYDSLIIATGVQPHAPFPVPINNISFLRTLDDAKTIRHMAKKGTHIAIIGGGPTGLEAAEAVIQQDVRITLIEYYPGLLPTMLDSDMSHVVHENIKKKKNLT